MQQHITIGRSDMAPVALDLMQFVESRMLVQASSGGGKSYCLRKIIEEAGSQLHTIVIDPEGEFFTLRERLDMVLIGRDGDVPADLKLVKALARKLVELRVSAIVDLSELQHGDRPRYVRQFLESIMSVGRSHWHPMLVAIDEAHAYCPESGKGQAESTAAVIDLMSRGRKRGFCGLLATQRLSKLNKDAAAECRNLLIGNTSPVDQERAADLLGIPRAQRNEFTKLDPGQFFATGPAIGRAVVRMRVTQVSTTHPKPGERYKMAAPEASEAIRRVLPELAAAASDKQEVYDLDAARRRIQELERQVQAQARLETKTPEEIIERRCAYEADAAKEARDKQWGDVIKERARELDLVLDEVHGVVARIDAIRKQIRDARPAEALVQRAPAAPVCPGRIRPVTKEEGLKAGLVRVFRERAAAPTDSKLGKCERLILSVLAQYPQGRSKVQVAIMTGYAHDGGGFNNAIGKLRTGGLAEGGSDCLVITPAGLDAVGHYEPLPRGADLLSHWCSRLGKCERRILEALSDGPLSKSDLAACTDYEATGGGFNNALGKLRTLELITRGEPIRLSGVFDD
jgi:hypothetical protein